MNKKTVAITLGIMCALLTSGIIIQVNTIEENHVTTTTSRRTSNSELKDEVIKWKGKYEQANEELQKVQEEIENTRKIATKDNNDYTETEENLNKINALLGLTELTGEGVVITVEDSATASINDENLSSELVHNTDIIELVNELKNAGAEAIAINGQRIISNSYINCVGSVITVNGEKLNSPFIISAIGNRASLSSITRPGSYIELMEEDGITVKVEKVDSVTIPKYKKVISSKYIRIKE